MNLPSKQSASTSSIDQSKMNIFEGLSVNLTPAPLVKRILAYIVDLGILSLIFQIVSYFLMIFCLLVVGVLAVLLKSDIQHIKDLLIFSGLGLFLLVSFAIGDGYFIYFEYKKGATLGKQALGLRVVATNKNQLSLAQCIFRDIFRFIDCSLVLPGLISMSLTKNHQRLGDLVCGTMVTYSESQARESQFFYLTQDQYYLFHESLKPQTPTLEHRNHFLKFAFAIFMTGKIGPLSEEEMVQWESFVLHYVPEAKKHDIDRISLFLFFAEYCLQNSHESN